VTGWRTEVLFDSRKEYSFLSKQFRLWGQFSLQFSEAGSSSVECSGGGVKLASHLHLVSNLRTGESIPAACHMPSRRE